MYHSYSLLVTFVLLSLLINTHARLSRTHHKRTIDDRRETPAADASRHQRPSRRLSNIPDRTLKSTDIYSDSNSFDWRIANASVSLSAFAYCANDTIVSFKNYTGPVIDFIPTNIVYNRYYDVHGFIGYSDLYQSIFVVFRGSLSIKNWLDDFDTLMTSYPLCTSCNVHRGFHFAAQSVKVDVITWVRMLQHRLPLYDIVVTGHSLGGALATLIAVELVRPADDGMPWGGDETVGDGGGVGERWGGWVGGAGGGLSRVRHVSFGSPRLANGNAARYISTMLNNVQPSSSQRPPSSSLVGSTQPQPEQSQLQPQPQLQSQQQPQSQQQSLPPRLPKQLVSNGVSAPVVRLTHYRDIVPHNPFTTLGYMHIQGEWYEDLHGNLRNCTAYEDPLCADQWTFDETIVDHLTYLNQQMWCTS